MILTEMVHDARIVRMNARAPAADASASGWAIRSAHWEGDTLVVDTTNFTDKTRFAAPRENLHVVERFTRVDAKTLLLPVHDRGSRDVDEAVDRRVPLAGDQASASSNTRCHEGNYAMGNILRGARVERTNDGQK